MADGKLELLVSLFAIQYSVMVACGAGGALTETDAVKHHPRGGVSYRVLRNATKSSFSSSVRPIPKRWL
jgi:hypothetical protein